MIHVMDVCDNFQQSWIGWQYKQFYPVMGYLQQDQSVWFKNGTFNEIASRALSRAYVTAVNGKMISQKYDHNSGNYTLVYNARASKNTTDTNLATEIQKSFYYIYPNISIKSSFGSHTTILKRKQNKIFVWSKKKSKNYNKIIWEINK